MIVARKVKEIFALRRWRLLKYASTMQFASISKVRQVKGFSLIGRSQQN